MNASFRSVVDLDLSVKGLIISFSKWRSFRASDTRRIHNPERLLNLEVPVSRRQAQGKYEYEGM